MAKIILLLLFTLSQTWADELTLYFVPSPKGMDWSSPSKLAVSALENLLTFEKRYIGHVFVELKCQDGHELTGMTGKRLDFVNQLIFQGKGLGILYHTFEGALEKKDDIRPELYSYLKTQKANFARFILNSDLCRRVTRYLTEYREKNVGKNYGLANRPRYGEGAGCTAFGVSFLDILGLIDQEMLESWSQRVFIPLEYAGPPVTDKSVGLVTIISKAKTWAPDSRPHKNLFFWSPDKMHKWVEKKVKLKQRDYKVIQQEKSQGIVFDKSHYPSPEDPIWLQTRDPEISKAGENRPGL